MPENNDLNFGCIVETDRYGIFRAWLRTIDIRSHFPWFEFQNDGIGYINRDSMANRGFRCKITSKKPRIARMNRPQFPGKTYIRFINGDNKITLTIPGFYEDLKSLFHNFTIKLNEAYKKECNVQYKMKDNFVGETTRKVLPSEVDLSDKMVEDYIKTHGLPAHVTLDSIPLMFAEQSEFVMNWIQQHGIPPGVETEPPPNETAAEVVARLGINVILDAHLSNLAKIARDRKSVRRVRKPIKLSDLVEKIDLVEINTRPTRKKSRFSKQLQDVIHGLQAQGVEINEPEN